MFAFRTINNQSFAGITAADPGGAPLTTKNEVPAPKFYKIEASEWQF